jgi:nucleotide-binding universal stress UspA family protein
MNRTVTQEPAPPVACAVFDRVLVGVDGSPESLEAARQAAVLQDGELALLAAWKLPQHRTVPTGAEVPYYFDADLERRRADEALAAARSAVAPGSRRQRSLGDSPGTS